MYRIKYMYGFALNHDCFRSKVKRVQHAFKSESTGGENHWRSIYGCCYSRSDTVESSTFTFVCFQCVNLLHVASCLNGFIYGWWYRYLGMIHCQLSGILTSYIDHGFQLSILNHIRLCNGGTRFHPNNIKVTMVHFRSTVRFVRNETRGKNANKCPQYRRHRTHFFL